MKIALAQMRVVAGDISQNLSRIVEFVKCAEENGCTGIVFPEMCVSGYFLGDQWECSSLLEEIEHAHAAILKLSANIWILFGSLGTLPHHRNEDGRTCKTNAAFVAHKCKWLCNTQTGLGFFPKALSPNYRMFDDSRHFYDLRKWSANHSLAGAELSKFLAEITIDGLSFGITICEDLWEENYTTKPTQLVAGNQKLVFNLSCSPFSEGKDQKRLALLTDVAKSNQTTICYLNSIGTQNVGKTVLGIDGQSLVIDPTGKIVAEGGFFDEELVVFSWDVSTNTPTNQRSILLKRSESGDLGTTKYSALENTLRFVSEEWKVNASVIGLSGGIDSALSAVLFSRVLGAQNVHLINMPSQFNSTLTKGIAHDLAMNLGCSYEEISIQDSVDATKMQLTNSSLSKHPRFKWNTWVDENVQARDRSARILAALAAAMGGVFPCNANKTETTVGYSTLYGDQSGFLCPLADLWKFEIYEMAELYNNDIFQTKIVPEACFKVTPSAELSLAQDVTKGLGDPLHYPYHDHLFRSWIERWDRWTPLNTLNAYIAGTLESELGCANGLIAKLFPTKQSFVIDLEKWWGLYVGMAAVKRMQAPPVLAISRRSFGWDHRESLGLKGTGPKYENTKTQFLSI